MRQKNGLAFKPAPPTSRQGRFALGPKMLVWIAGKKMSLPSLAAGLGVSKSTCARVVDALRRKGYEIVSSRDSNGWYYELRGSRQKRIPWKEDSLGRLGGVGSSKRNPDKVKWPDHDRILYGGEAAQ